MNHRIASGHCSANCASVGCVPYDDLGRVDAQRGEYSLGLLRISDQQPHIVVCGETDGERVNHSPRELVVV